MCIFSDTKYNILLWIILFAVKNHIQSLHPMSRPCLVASVFQLGTHVHIYISFHFFLDHILIFNFPIFFCYLQFPDRNVPEWRWIQTAYDQSAETVPILLGLKQNKINYLLFKLEMVHKILWLLIEVYVLRLTEFKHYRKNCLVGKFHFIFCPIEEASIIYIYSFYIHILNKFKLVLTQNMKYDLLEITWK